ncbi:MAG: DUF2505 family protein [bacterium]
MRYTAKHLLNGTLEEAMMIAKDRTRDERVYPNITSLKQVKWDETDTDIHCEFITRGDGEIPKPLRKLITPKMVSWRETGHWDKKNNTYEYQVKTFYFSNIFQMRGKIRFIPQGNDKILRELEGEIKINLPLLGQLAEKTIVKYQIDNLDKEAKIFEKDLEELRKKRGKM